jgi:hypothetical protein
MRFGNMSICFSGPAREVNGEAARLIVSFDGWNLRNGLTTASDQEARKKGDRHYR